MKCNKEIWNFRWVSTGKTLDCQHLATPLPSLVLPTTIWLGRYGLCSLPVFPLQSLPPTPARPIVIKFQMPHTFHLCSLQCLLSVCKTQLKHLNDTLEAQLASAYQLPPFGPVRLGVLHGTFINTLLCLEHAFSPLSFFTPYPFVKVFSWLPLWSLQPTGVSRYTCLTHVKSHPLLPPHKSYVSISLSPSGLCIASDGIRP